MEQDKNFKEFLKTLVEQNKAILVNQIVQSKTDKEFLKIQKQEYNVQTESVEKNLSQSKKLLEKIEKHLVKSGEVYKKTNEKIVGKLDNLGKLDKAPQSKIQADRDTRPLTFKEQLQQKVASVKSIGGSIARGVGAIGRTVSSPIKSAQSLGSSVQDKIYSGIEQGVGFVGDVLGTKEGFDVKKQRYAQAQLASSKLATDQSRGTVTAKEDVLSFKEKEFAAIQKLTKKIEELEKVKQERKPYGAGLSEQEQSEYESLASRRSKIESRGSKSIDARYRSGPEKLEESDSQKEAEKSAEVKRQENPEADNIVSAQEKLSDTAKEDLQLTKQLLETTKESVSILKDIRQSLADQIEPLRSKEKPIVQQEAANDSSGGSLLGSAADVLSNLPGRGAPGKSTPKPTGKPSLGGRIMGGIKSAGPGLLKGGAAALGGMALGYGAEKLVESGHEKIGGAVDVGAEALSGAGMGAMIGSIVPGIGTGIGAAIGGVAGGAYGLYKNRGNLFGGDEKKGDAKFPFEEEADKIAEEALKSGADPLNLENIIYDKLQEKHPNDDLEWIQTAAERAAMKANDKPKQKSDQSKSNKLQVYGKDGVKEYTFEELDKAVASGEVNSFAANNAKKFFKATNPEDYQKEYEKRSKAEAKPAETATGIKVSTGASGFPVAAAELKGGKNYEAYKKDLQESIPPIDTPDYRLKSKMFELSKTSLPRTDRPQSVENQNEKLRARAQDALDKELSEESIKNKDLEREAQGSNKPSAPIIMNNSSNNSTTKIMPMKADPRPSSRGSALDRHIDRVSTY